MVEDFVIEANERLDRVADLALTAEEGDGDSWAALQREIHTLKGAAGFLGLDQFSELCHGLEEFLLRTRPGDRRASDGFDVVHDACNLLRELVDAVERCAEDGGHLPREPRVVEIADRLKVPA